MTHERRSLCLPTLSPILFILYHLPFPSTFYIFSVSSSLSYPIPPSPGSASCFPLSLRFRAGIIPFPPCSARFSHLGRKSTSLHFLLQDPPARQLLPIANLVVLRQDRLQHDGYCYRNCPSIHCMLYGPCVILFSNHCYLPCGKGTHYDHYQFLHGPFVLSLSPLNCGKGVIN